MRPHRLAAAAGAALMLAFLVAGCGLGAGDSPGGATVLVTRDFGARVVGEKSAPKVPGGETVMRFVQRSFDVRTRYGGGFVQAIDGVAGGRAGGRPVDWFFYVNGIEAPKGAAATKVHDGDRIWWDHHDWGATQRIPAVVGSFPEPFRSGIDGRRFPLRIECDASAGAACDEVSSRLAAAGAKPARAVIGERTDLQTLRVLVGPWSAVRRDQATAQLDRGPGASGVYARFTDGGRTLVVLDAAGRSVRRLGAGAGLVAATSIGSARPTWVVTGTNAAGALAAARQLDERSLAHRFALAVAPSGATFPVPAEPAR